MNARVLAFPTPAPAADDRLLSVEEVVAIIGGERPPSRDWVLRYVPGKISLGHRTKRFREAVVRAWLRARVAA